MKLHAQMTQIVIRDSKYLKCGSCGYQIAISNPEKEERDRINRMDHERLAKENAALREEIAELRSKWEAERTESARLRQATSTEVVRAQSAVTRFAPLVQQPAQPEILIQPAQQQGNNSQAIVPTELPVAHESKANDTVE